MKQLDDYTFGKAKEWIKSKWGTNLYCEMCRDEDSFIIETNIYSMNVMDSRNQLPVLRVKCSNCANFKLLSPVAMGIMDNKGNIIEEPTNVITKFIDKFKGK